MMDETKIGLSQPIEFSAKFLSSSITRFGALITSFTFCLPCNAEFYAKVIQVFYLSKQITLRLLAKVMIDPCCTLITRARVGVHNYKG
jgi:hypothetical protein